MLLSRWFQPERLFFEMLMTSRPKIGSRNIIAKIIRMRHPMLGSKRNNGDALERWLVSSCLGTNGCRHLSYD